MYVPDMLNINVTERASYATTSTTVPASLTHMYTERSAIKYLLMCASVATHATLPRFMLCTRESFIAVRIRSQHIAVCAVGAMYGRIGITQNSAAVHIFPIDVSNNNAAAGGAAPRTRACTP